MKYIILSILLTSVLGLFAQEPIDSVLTLTDSVQQVERVGFWKRNYPDPKKATLMSAIVPGLGQVYNKHWWKTGIVYAAGGALVYAIDFNTSQYNDYRDAYIKRVDDDPETVDEQFDFLSDAGVRARRDYFDQNRQLSYVGLALLYILNVVDAFTSAHLNSFDLSDDLSLRNNFAPPDFTIANIGIAIPIQQKKQTTTLHVFEWTTSP